MSWLHNSMKSKILSAAGLKWPIHIRSVGQKQFDEPGNLEILGSKSPSARMRRSLA